MKKVFLIFQLLLVVMLAQAQMMNPVKFTSSLKTDGRTSIVSSLPFYSVSNFRIAFFRPQNYIKSTKEPSKTKKISIFS